MKWLWLILGALVVASLVGIVMVRLAKHDPARWHVDPTAVVEINASNQYRASAEFDVPPDRLKAALDERLKFDSATESVAGSVAEGWITFVVRTPLIGYPDYVSAKVEPAGDGSQITLYSRSRYGQSDLGANKKRVEAWISDLKAGLTKP